MNWILRNLKQLDIHNTMKTLIDQLSQLKVFIVIDIDGHGMGVLRPILQLSYPFLETG